MRINTAKSTARFYGRGRKNEQQLKTDFVAIAKLLNLPEQDAQNQDEVREGVKQWLAGNEKWLLILDNVDTPRGGETVSARDPQWLCAADNALTGRSRVGNCHASDVAGIVAR